MAASLTASGYAHRVFIVRMSEEHDARLNFRVSRFVLESPLTGERQCFASAEKLLSALSIVLCGQSPAEDAHFVVADPVHPPH
jgi:hypothetical protein